MPPDTIDNWQVYYNKKEIREYPQFNVERTIILKLDSIKNCDTITVRYNPEMPCRDCPTHLLIKDNKNNLLDSFAGTGNFKPISFPVSRLLLFNKNNGTTTFLVYYYRWYSKTEKILLFTIKLE